MSLAAFTETVLRRDRSVVLAGLVSIVPSSWAYIIYLARDMATMMNMSNVNLGMGMAMPAIQPLGCSGLSAHVHHVVGTTLTASAAAG